MYEWRLELLFKYAGNDLSKWQNAIWSKIQTYDGNWGIITHIDNNRLIIDTHKKDIHVSFSGKITQFSWHELHYNFKDIEFFPILLNNLHEYFNSQNCDVYLNPRSYKLLEEEYQNFEKQDQIEQRSLDEEAIESIEFGLLNDDDYIYSHEQNQIEQISSDEETIEGIESDLLSNDDYLYSDEDEREVSYFHAYPDDEETIERIESDLLNSDDYLYSDDYERELAYFLASQDDSYQDNHRKYLEEEYINQQSISWEEELEDHSKDASYLLSELEELLSEFDFKEADHYYYYECSEYLSYEAYQNKRNNFLQNLRQSLFSQLENLFIQDDYKNADRFYEDDCSEHINIEEYQQVKRLFLEKKRTSLLEELNQLLEKSFLETNDFYQNQCIPFISQVEYQQKKQIFIQSWVQKNNLGNKPDLEQSLAIGTVNNHVQVIARAGSGKTSTLVNRAIFLQKHCGIDPSEILLLAFNRKAADEIQERLKKHLPNATPYVMTYHALAYAIVHPKEKLIFDDNGGNQSQSQTLQCIIDDYLRNPDFYEEIKSLMMKRYRQDWTKIIEKGFEKKPEEIIKFRRSLSAMGIDGKYYKSFGEKVIADFLLEHNIPFEYEKNFGWRDNTNYRPDFTVFLGGSDKKGIVIEYFGLKGDPDYDEMSEQKRQYWENNLEWDFIELDPQLLREQNRESFENHLKLLLQGLKIKLNRLSEDEIWERIKDRGIDRFTKAMAGLVQRARKLCLTPDKLSEKINNHPFDNSEISQIEWQFLNLGQEFYKDYQTTLVENEEEDFDGLMQRAAKMINDGLTKFKKKSGSGDLKTLRYIMIDEYQDFSLLFYNLVQTIRKQNPQALFFCVGDDWQAINGFAGSDLIYYQNFIHIFNPSQKLNISTNYRSSSKIVELGNILMQGQGESAHVFSKEIGTVDIVNLSKFQPSSIEQIDYKNDILFPVILRLISKLVNEGKDVIILTRKNDFRGKSIDKFRQLIIKNLNLVGKQQDLVNISTTHQYKGKESQAVILIDPESYPLIHPDLLFNRIFGDNLEKVIDEERRLFYVALTRAKNNLFIIVENNDLPPFVNELSQKFKFESFDWYLYPAVVGEVKQITVKFSNCDGGNGTFLIKDRLRADGFKFSKFPASNWYRVYPFEKFASQDLRLDFLQNSIWSSLSNKVKVEFCNEQEDTIALHIANNGNWICGFDIFEKEGSNKISN